MCDIIIIIRSNRATNKAVIATQFEKYITTAITYEAIIGIYICIYSQHTRIINIIKNALG